MLQKFKELNWLEKSREDEGQATPTSQWARCDEEITKGLDRFGDIFVWKGNRVKLQVPDDHNDYIHASPLTLKSNRTGRVSKYIAMQAPKKRTTDHVWRMVWHELESPAVIVMLSTDQSYRYYPAAPSESMTINAADEFNDGFLATVTCESVETSADGITEIRKLIMTVEGEEKEKIVWHLLYTQWPDYGIPDETDTASLINLIALSNTHNLSPQNPRIVHCRAGVGRSGTFIVLDHLLGELQAGAFRNELGSSWESRREDDPVFDAVNTLRMQRPNMVQAPPQYRFVYQVLKAAWEEKYGRKLVESGASTPGGSRPGSRGGPPTKILRLVDAEDVFTD